MARSYHAKHGGKGRGYEYGGKVEGSKGYMHHSTSGHNWVKTLCHRRARRIWDQRIRQELDR